MIQVAVGPLHLRTGLPHADVLIVVLRIRDRRCGQIPPEFNLQVAGVRSAIGSSAALVDGRGPGWGEDDLIDQAPEDLGGFDRVSGSCSA